MKVFVYIFCILFIHCSAQLKNQTTPGQNDPNEKVPISNTENKNTDKTEQYNVEKLDAEYEKGKYAAEREISRGKLILLSRCTTLYEDRRVIFNRNRGQKLRQHGIEENCIEGKVGDKLLQSYIDGFNQVMREEIRKYYGSEFFE